MSEKLFTFVWWGDGYFVYDRAGRYVGKDDQMNLVDELRRLEVVEVLNDGEEVGLAYGRGTLEQMRDAIAAGGDPE